MATSGAIASTMTARQVITRGLRIASLLATGETADGAMMSEGVETLNFMLKNWQNSSPDLWRVSDGSVTLVAGTATYTLSPRPVKVYECRYRYSSGVDLPMEQLARDDYTMLPLKTSTGIPVSYYVDKQISSTTLTVWPVPAAVTTETLRYTYQRVIEDVTNANENIDVPQEALDLVCYGLASKFADEYGLTGERVKRIADQFMMMKRDFDGFDREPYIQFVPG